MLIVKLEFSSNPLVWPSEKSGGVGVLGNLLVLTRKVLPEPETTQLNLITTLKYKLGCFAPQIAEKLVEAGQSKYTSNSNKHLKETI